MKSKSVQIRQGDVLLVPVSEIPGNAHNANTNGRAVLAHGEVTGHAHVLDAPPGALRYRVTQEGKRFERLYNALLHENE